MSALLERQSHWFKVALPNKTAVPLVFDLAQRRDLLRRADTPFDCNSKSKVTLVATNWCGRKIFCSNDLQASSEEYPANPISPSMRCVLISYLVVPSNGRPLLHPLRPNEGTVFIAGLREADV